MNKTFITVALILVTIFISEADNHIYLSPTGSDFASGTIDSPLKSLTAARNRIRTMSLSSIDTVYVEIASGNYFMSEPLILTPKDSSVIIFRASDPEIGSPNFSGGKKIECWAKDSIGHFFTMIPEVKGGNLRFDQLWVNGTRAIRARTPNKGWFMVNSSKETDGSLNKSRMPELAIQEIKVNPENLASLRGMNREEIERVMVLYYHKWDVTRKGLAYAIPDSGKLFHLGKGMKFWNPIAEDSRYILENYRGALDAPGEWFLDQKSGVLQYIPREGETLKSLEFIAPIFRQFVIIVGQENNQVKNKIFQGISFNHSSYLLPTYGNDAEQASASIEAAIEVENAQHIIFEDCEVQRTGAYAIWLKRGSNNNTIRRCYLADLGAGGIKISETTLPFGTDALPQGNLVDNNIITDGGSVFPAAVGILLLNTANNKIIHNEISNIRYSGISAGWFWGYNNETKRSPSVENIIEYNHIHHIGWGELSDMGAIYTLGESPGTTVSNNLVHDVYSYGYGGWGLYTDEGSTGIEIENNLVYGCKNGAFHQHYGKQNVIRNNIFAFGILTQIQFSKVENHRSFDFTNNIVLSDCGSNFSHPWDLPDAWKKANVLMDQNLYWDIRGDSMKFEGVSFREWKEVPHDIHSIVADPLFTDPVHLDFTFRSRKNAHKVGFKPFDYTKAGVYGSPEWIEKAKLDPAITEAFRQIVVSQEKNHPRMYDN